MATTQLKPRWEAWEKACLQQAYAQKIQHRIMATALGRTVPSVSKKIQTLGLKVTSQHPRPIKGRKYKLSLVEKIPQDLSKMVEILKSYAPLSYFQERQQALHKGCWTKSNTSLVWDEKKGTFVDSIECHEASFSYLDPLDFIPSKESMSSQTRTKKILEDAAYVPLYYIEKWASLEGFHRIRGALKQIGLSYWKDGRYFSQAQLLMHVNRLRLDLKLQPIVLIEEEQEPST